ncbi:von Willebrand factor C domain-containing protein 2-like [Lates calcarifer]|uniref:von Willebrand factor C domain-containing protein 2-like n=1 Tax=Lates calcarifer TaxID=8187 RepID=A0AAJ7VHD8_LATCA|nr:von Willebrand factor C domain-containing protein 2-like [Lates calcarifer]
MNWASLQLTCASLAPLTVGRESHRSATVRHTVSVGVGAGNLFSMSHRHYVFSFLPVALVQLCLLLLLPPHGPGSIAERAVAAEYSSKTDLDYEFGDYRGKWCIDDHGFVYGIGEVYFPSPTACPCTCTVDGPVCVRPKCPRIHPRCTRIRYKACCPVCEAMARVCVYGGKTYRLLEEFRLSRCERCRCEANREVYCSISDCPAPHCVNPTYEPNHCCPICNTGPNCFAGSRVIPAGERVNIDEQTVCYCTYQDGTWHTHPHATCEQHPHPSLTPDVRTEPPRDEDTRGKGGRTFIPRLDVIP